MRSVMLAGAELEDQDAYAVRCGGFRWRQLRPGP